MTLLPTVRFVVPSDPAAGRVNALYGRSPGDGNVFKRRGARAYQELVAAHGRAAQRASGLAMFLGPVEVRISVWYTSARPDADAHTKVVLDALQATHAKLRRVGAGIVRNDRQIRVVHVTSDVDPDEPRTEVEVVALDEEGALERERRELRKLIPRERLSASRLRPSVKRYG